MSVSTDRLYEGGRYWLGAGLKFIEFPRMQMAYVWSSTYKKSRKFTDNDSLVTVNTKSITARSQDGLKITIDLSLHYKVGTQFQNRTKLTQEFVEIYTRYGDPIISWSKIINKVTVASLNNAFQSIQAFDIFRKREETIAVI